jgi:ribosomal protein S18 acetylase RimI-like enzyme
MNTARLASATDADEMVRLACVMFVSMGLDEPDAGWRAVARAHIAGRLGHDAVGAVVDHPTVPGRLVASGAASVSTRLPTPMNIDGRSAYVQWVATDEEFRGHGHARAVMTTLLDRLDEQGVTAIELHATPMGERLYRSLGFWEGIGAPALRRRRWDPPPSHDRP